MGAYQNLKVQQPKILGAVYHKLKVCGTVALKRSSKSFAIAVTLVHLQLTSLHVSDRIATAIE